MEAELPPGFRFHPRDEELLSYLAGWISGDRLGFPAMITDIDFSKYEPWALPSAASVGGKQWYFYRLPSRKYASGHRTNRSTVSGFWKATGKDRAVVEPRTGCVLGMRKTLVFYHGKASTGTKTSWVMHEFRLEISARSAIAGNAAPSSSFSSRKEYDWVLCRVFYRGRVTTFEASIAEEYGYVADDGACPSSFSNPPATEFCNTRNLDQHPQPSVLGGWRQGAYCSTSAAGLSPGQRPDQWLQQTAPSPAASWHALPAAHGMLPETGEKSLVDQSRIAPGWGPYLNKISFENKAIQEHLQKLALKDGGRHESDK